MVAATAGPPLAQTTLGGLHSPAWREQLGEGCGLVRPRATAALRPKQSRCCLPHSAVLPTNPKSLPLTRFLPQEMWPLRLFCNVVPRRFLMLLVASPRSRARPSRPSASPSSKRQQAKSSSNPACEPAPSIPPTRPSSPYPSAVKGPAARLPPSPSLPSHRHPRPASPASSLLASPLPSPKSPPP